jgi:hypothetical protein
MTTSKSEAAKLLSCEKSLLLERLSGGSADEHDAAVIGQDDAVFLQCGKDHLVLRREARLGAEQTASFGRGSAKRHMLLPAFLSHDRRE